MYLVHGPDGRAELLALFSRLNCDVREFVSAQAFLAEYRPGTGRCLVFKWNGCAADGLGLLERLQERHPRLPVIVLAARGTVPIAVRAMRAGAAAFLESPWARGLLLKEIRRFLD